MRSAHVDYGDIHPVPFNNVDQIIRRSVRLSDGNVCVCYSVLTQNGFDLVVVDIRERHGVCNGYTALIFLPNGDRWRFLVQSDPETFELGFDDFLIAEGFKHVQDNEDQVACPSNLFWKECQVGRVVQDKRRWTYLQ